MDDGISPVVYSTHLESYEIALEYNFNISFSAEPLLDEFINSMKKKKGFERF